MKKVLSALTLTALLAAMLVGCGNKPPKNPDDWTDKDFENAANQLEEQYEKDKEESKKAEETEAPEAEEVVYAPTEEIINADFRSGLFQFNNDIFQQGGYITVADFVEKYKDRYDIEYNYVKNHLYEAAPYEECTDYLVTYYDISNTQQVSMGRGYNYLKLTPKYGNVNNKINAYIINMTSPDEKIALDEAIVLFCEVPEPNYKETSAPIWVAKGLKPTFSWQEITPLESENEKYNPKTFSAMLEENGFEYSEDTWSFEINKYKKNHDVITLYFAGETNLFGLKPVYSYTAYFDPNTDKLDRVTCELYKFVTE